MSYGILLCGNAADVHRVFVLQKRPFARFTSSDLVHLLEKTSDGGEMGRYSEGREMKKHEFMDENNSRKSYFMPVFCESVVFHRLNSLILCTHTCIHSHTRAHARTHVRTHAGAHAHTHSTQIQ
ncbi:hypothetical protein EVAR_632_1 [Eumeta japonica]|uniref:Uncharacterized protein n=1 Tax=Eumeta variegata TaxID=151549 RepID=A0A4C1SB84_EUMVA|nr:hypothetical protein EVAR_632_1 [Eumeta japonica]